MFTRVVPFVVAALVSLSITHVAVADDDEPNPFTPTAAESSGPAVMLRSKADGGPQTQYTSDSMAGVLIRLGEDQQFAVHPQVGYSKDGFGFDGASVACGLGIGSAKIGYVSYQPRFVLGSENGDIAIGMRNGLTYHSPHDIFTAELGHQFISNNDSLQHDVRATIGLNAGSLLDLFL